ncbi:RNA polymerase II C-terminal domain phosphatase-like 4 [Quercus suber]|uniref:RNA polymerase II C-terminal domain phosphatase-like 4 n=1 Tax=Quercus suber TaxID=58331 RepID=UPI0032E04C3C
MVLVLDLDQTLIHSTEQEKYLRTPQELIQHELRDSLFRPSRPWEKMMLKLRPFVHTFLKEASTMFEIYMCTTGTRSYALKVTEFLDPENVYFKYSRIIAREDLFETGEKSLDLVLREQRMVLALDGSKSVWRKNEVNLILVKKYHYFDSDDDLSHVSLSALETDEDETTGTLPAVLEELKVIHRLFFNPKFEAGLNHRDVGFIFARRSILRGCTLSFKHIFPSDFMRENSRLWLMAEELGAKFSMDNLLYPITHMVTWFATAEFQEAELEEFILVHPKWLRACYYAVSRVSENDYLIKLENPSRKLSSW